MPALISLFLQMLTIVVALHHEQPCRVCLASGLGWRTMRTLTGVNKTLLFGAVALVLVLLVSWQALGRIKQQVRSDLHEKLRSVLYTTNEGLHIWLTVNIDYVRHLSSMQVVTGSVSELLKLPRGRAALLASPALRQLRDFIAPQLSMRDDLGFFVISPDGLNIASMRDRNLGTKNLLAAKGPYLDKIFDGQAQFILPMLSDMPLPGATGRLAQRQPTMFFGIPITSEDGETIAAFTVRMDPLRDFTRIIQIARTGETGDVYAFDRSGTIISESRFGAQLRKLGLIKPDETGILSLTLRDPGGNMLEGFRPVVKREELPLTHMAQQAIAGKSGFELDGYRDYRGVPVVGTWLWDEDHGFGLAFEIDVAEAYRSYHIIRLIVAGLLAMTVVMFAGLSAGLLGRQRQTEAANLRLNTEISEHQRTNRALIESEDKFRTIFEGSSDAIMLLDKNAFTDCNDTTLRIFACASRDDFIGRHPGEYSPPTQPGGRDSREAADEKIAKAFREGKNLFEWTHRRATGEDFPTEVLLTPLKLQGRQAMQATVRDITARKRAEEALKQSEASLAEAQRMAHVGNWEWDIASSRITWSDETFRIFGLRPRELEPTYDTFISTVHPDDREDVREVINGSLKNKTRYNVEHRIVLPDGTERFVHEQGKGAYDADGNPLRMMGTVHDITERKKAEDKLRVGSAVIDNTAEGILVTDAEGVIVSVNAAFQSITGFSRNDALGKTPRILRSGEQDDSFYKNLWHAITTIGKWEGEIWNKRKGGEIYPQETTINAIYNEKEEIVQYAAIFSDITERKRAEEELRRSEYKIRTIFETSVNPIISITEQGTVQMFNPAAEKMFGYKASEVVGKNVTMLMPEPVRGLHREGLQRYLTTGENKVIGKYCEVEALRANGSLVPIHLSVSEVSDKEGKREFVGMLTDITERKRAEEALCNISSHDSLTGIFNRRAFDEAITTEWNRMMRIAGSIAIVMLDIDFFKNYNDTYGHPAGDECLRKVADVLKNSVKRAGEVVARYGGEEFVIILPTTELDGALVVAERARSGVEALALPHKASEAGKVVTVSAGVASVIPKKGTSHEGLLKQADTALYRAKSEGRNRVMSVEGKPVGMGG